jgi:hypothetical protein
MSNICNVNSISNVPGTDFTININNTGDIPVNLNFKINSISFSITANSANGDLTISNANSSNIFFNLYGTTGVMSMDSTSNLFWNYSQVWTDAYHPI